MKRRVLMVLALLVAGAVVNMAVAWGCAVWIPASGPYIGERRAASLTELEADGAWRFWAIERYARSGAVLYRSHWDTRSELLDCDEITTRSTDLKPSELAPSWAGLRTPPAADYEIRHAHAYGWPFISMWQDYLYTGGGYGGDLVHGLQLAFLPADGGFARAVPLCPIWPGFAVNALFYAAVLCVPICGLFALRRLIRRRRGLCPACAYPMGESAVCTECGKPLPGRAEAVA